MRVVKRYGGALVGVHPAHTHRTRSRHHFQSANRESARPADGSPRRIAPWSSSRFFTQAVRAWPDTMAVGRRPLAPSADDGRATIRGSSGSYRSLGHPRAAMGRRERRTGAKPQLDGDDALAARNDNAMGLSEPSPADAGNWSIQLAPARLQVGREH